MGNNSPSKHVALYVGDPPIRKPPNLSHYHLLSLPSSILPLLEQVIESPCSEQVRQRWGPCLVLGFLNVLNIYGTRYHVTWLCVFFLAPPPSSSPSPCTSSTVPFPALHHRQPMAPMYPYSNDRSNPCCKSHPYMWGEWALGALPHHHATHLPLPSPNLRHPSSHCRPTPRPRPQIPRRGANKIQHTMPLPPAPASRLLPPYHPSVVSSTSNGVSAAAIPKISLLSS